MTTAELTARVVAALTTELHNDDDFDADVLGVKADAAVCELLERRNYHGAGKGNDYIENDIARFYPVVLEVTRSDYNHIGAEGENSHTENGVARHWQERDKLWGNVHALVQVL